jgi:hypothetical protein
VAGREQNPDLPRLDYVHATDGRFLLKQNLAFPEFLRRLDFSRASDSSELTLGGKGCSGKGCDDTGGLQLAHRHSAVPGESTM